MGFFSKKKSVSPDAQVDSTATNTDTPQLEVPPTEAAPIVQSDDPFAAQRTAGDDPFATQRTADDSGAIGSLPSESGESGGVRRTSKEWDAAKVTPSQFQKRKGSLYATPASRDSHHGSNDRDKAYHEKIKEKGWGIPGKSK